MELGRCEQMPLEERIWQLCHPCYKSYNSKYTSERVHSRIRFPLILWWYVLHSHCLNNIHMFFPCIFFDGTCFFHDVYVIHIPSTTYILFPLLPHTSLHCRKSYTSKCTSGRVRLSMLLPCHVLTAFAFLNNIHIIFLASFSMPCTAFHIASN